MSVYAPSDAQVAEFCAVAGCDSQQARFLLEATNGNVDSAMHMLYENAGNPTHHQSPLGAAPAMNAPPLQGAPLPPRPRAPQAPTHRAPARPAAARPAAFPLALVGAAVRLPFVIIRHGVVLVGSALGLGMQVAGTVGDRVLPARVMRAARGVAGSLQRALSEEHDPAAQARRFVASFKSAYGDRHPRWQEAGWAPAAAAAHGELRFLLVYLHAAEHQDTAAFCADVLCAPDVVAYVNEEFLCWGGDVRAADAFGLAGRLGVTSYPFLALLAYSSSRTKLVASVQGAVSQGVLLGVLRRAVEEQGVLLAAEREERRERDESRRLLAEQNAEYEAALLADREREARREEERRQAAEARRAVEEAEAKVRAEVEAQQRRAADRTAALEARRQQKASALPPEPSTSGGAGDVASVRIRLPDGSTHQRRFPAAADLAVVYDFVDSLQATQCWKYSLASSYPRRVFARDGGAGQTLHQAGLAPTAMLLVQPEDEDEAEVTAAAVQGAA